jgi:flavin-binding protein dodecin
MTVRKAVDLTGSGSTVEEAISSAVDRAGMTIEGITSFDVVQLSGVLDGARITYEAQIRVWFTVRERMHG